MKGRSPRTPSETFPASSASTIRSWSSPRFAEHSDAWIALKIRSELLVKANVSATATKVDVKDGIVTLTGTAENLAQKDLTEVYAKDIDNVKSVRNEIVVEAPTAGSSTVGEDH